MNEMELKELSFRVANLLHETTSLKMFRERRA